MVERGVATSPQSRDAAAQQVSGDRSWIRQVLFGCGILSSLLYTAMLVFIPMQWAGYSSASQTVSELSAIDAPTRALWVAWLGLTERSSQYAHQLWHAVLAVVLLRSTMAADPRG